MSNNFLKSGISNPLLPFIVLLMLVILITVIASNLKEIQRTNSSGSAAPVPDASNFRKPGAVPAPVRASSGEASPDIAALTRAALEDWRNGDLQNAEDKFRTALVFQPDNPVALSYLGTLFHHRGDYKTAELMFRRQTLYFPTNPSGYMNLGLTLLKQNRFDEALAESKRAYVLDPASDESALNIAKILVSAGEKGMALAYLRRAARSGSANILNALWDPVFDPIRDDPEFLRIRSSFQRKSAEPQSDRQQKALK